jgi:hypothetical protein
LSSFTLDMQVAFLDLKPLMPHLAELIPSR